jgi:hypothetical protein
MASRTSDHNKREQNLQDFKSLLTFRQGLHDSFLLFRFVKFQLAVTTVVQTPNLFNLLHKIIGGILRGQTFKTKS